MPVIVSLISQKGGVGKSTLARGLAAVAARGKLRVKLADLDVNQQTAVRWAKSRADRKSAAFIDVEAFRTIDEALEGSQDFDLLVIDTPGHASSATLDVARNSHLVVLPSGGTSDDLYPTILLLHALVQIGFPRNRAVVALCRILEVGEERSARSYIENAAFEVLPGCLPESLAYRNAQNRGQAFTEPEGEALSERASVLIEGLLKKIATQVKAAKATTQSGTGRQS